MNPGGCGNQAVRETHAPRKRSGSAVVAVSGEEAADSSNAVAKGGSGRARIEHGQQRNLAHRSQPGVGGEASDQSAEPGEAVLTENVLERMGEKFRGGLEFVIELGSDDASEAGKSDEGFGRGGG